MFNGELETAISRNHIDFLAYINANDKYVSGIKRPFKGFHIIRDPRDIVVSSYFSSLSSHPTNEWPELIHHRQKLKQISKDEGLFLEMEFIQDVMENLSAWNYEQPNVLELRFEDVTRAPYQSFLDIFQFLACLDDQKMTTQRRMQYLFVSLARRKLGLFGKGGGIPADVLLGKVYENRFSRKTVGRTQGMENVKSHFRKGMVGDWVNHFTSEHVVIFKKKYGDLLVKLGYEQENNW
jgi:hypothetical protein